MFKRLANLWRPKAEPRHPQPSSVSPMSGDMPDVGEIPPTHAGTEAALRRFMQLVTAHLDSQESRRLTDAVASDFDAGGDAVEAFNEGVLGDEGQQLDHWLVIQVDWKAHEEIEWQVDAVAARFGLLEKWRWSSPPETRTVPAGLCAAAGWASSFGHELVHLDLGHDAFYALMVKGEDAAAVYQAAASAGLSVLDTAAFARANA